MQKFKKLSLIILTLLGLFTSLELCKIYYDANFNPYALGSFCSVNDLIDCDGVAQTVYSQFLGIPLALWGVFLYSFLLFLIFAKNLSNFKLFKFAEVFKNPQAYVFCLTSLAFVISVCLAGISIFQIHKICVFCFATYCIDLMLAVISKDLSQPFFYELKLSFSDFKDAIKIKKYLISFIAVTVLFAGLLVYTSTSCILTPQLKKSDLALLKNFNKKNTDNTLGDKNAKVVIYEYIDFNCIGCYILNLNLHRAIEELDGIYLEQHHLPLDGECNRLVTKGHEGSCMLARYVLAAKKQKKYWQASNMIFEKMPKTEKETIKLLSTIRGINTEKLQKDANSDEIKTELKTDIDTAINKDISGTPTIIINLQKHTGSMPYNELKEMLISAGATEKGK